MRLRRNTSREATLRGRRMCETGVIGIPPKAILLRPEAHRAVLVGHHPHGRIDQGFTQISLARRPQNTNLRSGLGIRSPVHNLSVLNPQFDA